MPKLNSINDHPLIEQAYNLMGAIEECGASEKLTDATCKASDLMNAIREHVMNDKRTKQIKHIYRVAKLYSEVRRLSPKYGSEYLDAYKELAERFLKIETEA